MNRTIVHASDLHIGRSIPDRLAAFRAHVAKTRPDLVVLSGDLVDDGRKVQFDELDAYLSSLHAPLMLTAGNHDAPVHSLTLRLIDPFRRMERMRGYEPEMRLGADVAVAGLRTAAALQPRLDWSLGDAPRGRVRRSLRLLDAAPARWRLVACHHALIDPPEAVVMARTINGEDAHRMLEDANVDFLLCGHGHKSFLGPLSATGRMWTSLAPTLSSPRARKGPQGFHVLALGRGEARAALWEWDGAQFAPHEDVHLIRRADRASGVTQMERLP